ncbi:GNAT family N-acetyltransferase [Micromonospora sp. DT233]|uniref:GNAT family N-acetyltransferase n=1 Tax=Micromonospora sp. DT233 TaxID=3393432 RepID=UPI003CEBE62E
MLNGRLVAIRPTRVTDLDFLADLAVADGVRHHVVGWNWPIGRDGQEEWLRQSQRDPAVRRLTVAAVDTDEPLGLTGLWEIDWHNRSALTAVKLMPGLAPRGAGTDSIMLIMAWAFYEVGLRRLHSTILPFNAPSLGAYVRKCGWRIEGRDREAVFRRGEWHDLLRVAMLRPEFDALADAEEYVQRVCGPRAPMPTPAPGQSTNASVQSAPERPERASSIATA